MRHPGVQQMIKEAKAKLVKEKILKPGVLNKTVQPHDAHAADSYDWRYLSAGLFL